MDKLQPGQLFKLCQPNPIYPSTIYLQAHQSKTLPDPNGERLRLMLNDGQYAINGIFKPSPEKPHLDNFLRYSVLEITNYEITPTAHGKVFIVIDDAKVISQGEKRSKNFEMVDKVVDITALGGGPATTDNASATAASTSNAGAGVSTSTNNANKPKPATSSKPKHKVVDNLYSIDQLSPYQNNWTIKARVSYKGDIRTWHNQRGEGKLFNVNLLDETGEIRATGFNANVDKFYDLLQENQVYYISKCSMQMAKPKFSNLSHQYELGFDRDTVIEPVDSEDASDVPKVHFDFVKLDQVQNLQAGAIIDVIDVILPLLMILILP
ncbi:unnamed protein product [Ambrosiozyma monospora]|uniref:Unnamed protein product n=1 Tax=Ambrosiozyma monospora TaxID=43982 RepID=A0ACB5TCL0_AMBMO|nr:unnamed protein product [Ambrosiozyma monospora]